MIAASALILSFPNFNLVVFGLGGVCSSPSAGGSGPAPWQSFFLGWLFGSVFFYGTCYWLTYSMINFGGFADWQAFAMLIPGALTLGVFPALVAMVLACSVRKWGTAALLLAPIIWAAMEWARARDYRSALERNWLLSGLSPVINPAGTAGGRLCGRILDSRCKCVGRICSHTTYLQSDCHFRSSARPGL